MDNYHLGYSLLYETGVEKNEKVKFVVLVKNPTQFYLITQDCDNFETLDTRFGNKRWTLEKYNLKEEDLLRLEEFKITPVLFDKSCGLEIKWKYGITSKGPAVKVVRILFDHIKEQYQSDAPIVTDIFDVNPIEAGKLAGQGQVEPPRQPISSIKKKPNSTRASEKNLSSSEEAFSSKTATSRPKNSKKKVHFLSKEFKLKQVEDQEKESTPVTELSKRQCFLKARDHINGQAIQERLGITKKIPKKEASSLEKREKRTSFIKAREQINEQTRFNITPTALKEENTLPGIVHPRSRVEKDGEASHVKNTDDITIEKNYELTQNAVAQQSQLPTGNIGKAVQHQTCSQITSTQKEQA
uniref:Uncharacterized protein n=3 Tax=Clytia hemisphaerica TaxID=252671 RepID=A0A7M5V225_9CNID